MSSPFAHPTTPNTAHNEPSTPSSQLYRWGEKLFNLVTSPIMSPSSSPVANPSHLNKTEEEMGMSTPPAACATPEPAEKKQQQTPQTQKFTGNPNTYSPILLDSPLLPFRGGYDSSVGRNEVESEDDTKEEGGNEEEEERRPAPEIKVNLFGGKEEVARSEKRKHDEDESIMEEKMSDSMKEQASVSRSSEDQDVLMDLSALPVPATTKPVRRGNRRETLVEFDPLHIPQDWMMQFQSPALTRTTAYASSNYSNASSKLLDTETPRSSLIGNPGSVLQNGKRYNSPPMSLLDTVNEFAVTSPMSIPKYTERDLQARVKEVKDEAEREMSFLNISLNDVEQKYNTTLEEKERLQTLLDDYERTMKGMIEEHTRTQQVHTAHIQRLTDENALVRSERDETQVSFKELRARYDEIKGVAERLKQNEEILQKTIEALKKDIDASEQRYEKLKEHAEVKLDEANTEIARVRRDHSNQIAALNAKLQAAQTKLSRSEDKATKLEEELSRRNKENEELERLCEDLVAKLEGR